MPSHPTRDNILKSSTDTNKSLPFYIKINTINCVNNETSTICGDYKLNYKLLFRHQNQYDVGMFKILAFEEYQASKIYAPESLCDYEGFRSNVIYCIRKKYPIKKYRFNITIYCVTS